MLKFLTILPLLLLQTQPAARDARQTTTAFLDAALNGRLQEAAAMADPSSAYAKEEKIKEFARLNLKSLPVASVHANARFALAVTDPATVNKPDNRTGPLSLDLVFKNNRWLIRDVDHTSKENADAKVKAFTDRFKDAKPIAPAPTK